MKKRDLFIVIGAIVVAIFLSAFIFLRTSLPTASWGLSFRAEGAAPIGPASQAQLEKYDAAYIDPSGEKVIYLTFDAGYENGATGKILDTLKKHNAPAAFFLVGHYIEKKPDLVRRMISEGHIVGNHTMHHPDASNLSAEAFQKELQELEQLYFDTVGQEMSKFYRPPQGIYSEENLKIAQKLGYKTVFWSLAYADWDNNAQPDPLSAKKKLLGRTHDGMVLLLHCTSQTNAQILDDLLSQWEELGYEFRSIEELFS